MSQATHPGSRVSGAARQLLRDSIQAICCSEEEEERVDNAREVAVMYSTEAPEAWRELWDRLMCTFQRTLELYSYSYAKREGVEPLIDVDDDKQAPSVKATAHIRGFLGCCELALQLLRAGCSSGPVAPPTADLLTVISDTCALRIHAQVQSNPDNVAFTVGTRDGELPKLSLARIETVIQEGAVQMLIQLLDVQDLVLSYAQQIARLLNLTSAFITSSIQSSEPTELLATTTLELFGSVAAAFPHVLVEASVSAALDILLARLLDVAENCCRKPASIVAETRDRKQDISVQWCVNVLGTARRMLLYCSPILAEKHRQTIEGAVCTMLAEMTQGAVQPLPKHKALKREPKSLVRSDTHIQLAVLELAQVEVQTLQHTGGIGANVALLRPCASLFVRATSAPLRDAAVMCVLVTDTLVRPTAAPLDLQPAVRRMEERLANKANSDHSTHAFIDFQQPAFTQNPVDDLQPESEGSHAQKKRFNLADHLNQKPVAQQEQQSATKKPRIIPSFGLPAPATKQQPQPSGAAPEDDDDLPDIVLDDPDQL